ncbi:MAG: methyltransferase [Candidatus Bathyarchaeota archaeon B63]|nr:MAG: methyltransferase [Candidatus Bathyarchaeota archaeon B63]
MGGFLRRILAEKLERWELEILPGSYDVVGDIAVIRIGENLRHRIREIAEAIIQINKHVKTVLNQTSPVSGDLRLRRLEWVMGEKKTETIHREHGCLFKVDLERCYFSPRLSFERLRVARQATPSEVIVNMFAGVGCFSILIAKKAGACRVYSIDINPWAVKYAEENVRLNRVSRVVEPILGDARDVIEERLVGVADRVLMPLPERAYEYIDSAVESLRAGGGTIHYYDFVHASKGEDPIGKIEGKVGRKLSLLGLEFNVEFGRIVRTVGPRWFQVALDIHVRKKD